MAKPSGPILFKTVKKAEDGHHGGAWKVAYADFVTAMMAFFLLLWLLNSTTEEQKEGISNYFRPTVGTDGGSGAGGLFGGISASVEGVVDSPGAPDSSQREIPDAGQLDTQPEGTGQDQDSTGSVGTVNREQEDALFNSYKRLLEQQLDQLPKELENLKKSVVIEITEEGLRIEIMSDDGEPNFLPGSTEMTNRTKMAMRLVAAHLERLPNKVSITGHTARSPDPVTNRQGWGLSVARANVARRELIARGTSEQRFQTIIGKGDSEPRVQDDPAAAQNDRLSIVLLRLAPGAPAPGQEREPPALAIPAGAAAGGAEPTPPSID